MGEMPRTEVRVRRKRFEWGQIGSSQKFFLRLRPNITAKSINLNS